MSAWYNFIFYDDNLYKCVSQKMKLYQALINYSRIYNFIHLYIYIIARIRICIGITFVTFSRHYIRSVEVYTFFKGNVFCSGHFSTLVYRALLLFYRPWSKLTLSWHLCRLFFLSDVHREDNPGHEEQATECSTGNPRSGDLALRRSMVADEENLFGFGSINR